MTAGSTDAGACAYPKQISSVYTIEVLSFDGPEKSNQHRGEVNHKEKKLAIIVARGPDRLTRRQVGSRGGGYKIVDLLVLLKENTNRLLPLFFFFRSLVSCLCLPLNSENGSRLGKTRSVRRAWSLAAVHGRTQKSSVANRSSLSFRVPQVLQPPHVLNRHVHRERGSDRPRPQERIGLSPLHLPRAAQHERTHSWQRPRQRRQNRVRLASRGRRPPRLDVPERLPPGQDGSGHVYRYRRIVRTRSNSADTIAATATLFAGASGFRAVAAAATAAGTACATDFTGAAVVLAGAPGLTSRESGGV